MPPDDKTTVARDPHPAQGAQYLYQRPSLIPMTVQRDGHTAFPIRAWGVAAGCLQERSAIRCREALHCRPTAAALGSCPETRDCARLPQHSQLGQRLLTDKVGRWGVPWGPHGGPPIKRESPQRAEQDEGSKKKAVGKLPRMGDTRRTRLRRPETQVNAEMRGKHRDVSRGAPELHQTRRLPSERPEAVTETCTGKDTHKRILAKLSKEGSGVEGDRRNGYDTVKEEWYFRLHTESKGKKITSCKELQGDRSTNRAWTPQTASEELTGSQSENRRVSVLLGGPGGRRETTIRSQCQVPAQEGVGSRGVHFPQRQHPYIPFPRFHQPCNASFSISRCQDLSLSAGSPTGGLPLQDQWTFPGRVAAKEEFPVGESVETPGSGWGHDLSGPQFTEKAGRHRRYQGDTEETRRSPGEPFSTSSW
ncbi:unnamed protein product [Rangifer tarandus platyrhynchus]|uniref:Uncharacterized protein n=2 Tax=Rangifer tarandus platyrhynchus TaxID=3082113 RepID=A0ACB0F4Y7_RANTA|nr:unnamed protein product [Rangifer tarandus platyrhynchus]CAI9707724.1 unnamed protein product [Rangifer tarandus platyrhynchus]